VETALLLSARASRMACELLEEILLLTSSSLVWSSRSRWVIFRCGFPVSS
jgi:hypothetical protein